VRVPSEVESKREWVVRIWAIFPLFLFLHLCISRSYPLKMRNLGLRAVHNVALPNANLSAVAIDLEEDTIYVTSERQNGDIDIEVEVLKLGSQQDGTIHVRDFRSDPIVTG